MSKYWLLVWNPSKWDWANSGINSISELKRDIDQLGFAIAKWSCGVNKNIHKDDNFFLIRLGVEPKGIVGYGKSLSDVFEGLHWDADKMQMKAKRIYIKFKKIFDAEKETIIGLEDLRKISGTFHWTPQASGISMPDDIASKLLKLIEKN